MKARTKRSHEWPDAAEAILIDMRRKGFSGTPIAKELARQGYGPYTRNAVCGKLDRLKREGVSLAPCRYRPQLPAVTTTAALGAVLERLCDISTW